MEIEILRNLLTAPLWFAGVLLLIIGFLPGELELNDNMLRPDVKAVMVAVGATVVLVAAWLCV